MSQHSYYKCKEPCKIKDCALCSGLLQKACTICNGVESKEINSLATECPNKRQARSILILINSKHLDFKDGAWVKIKDLSPDDKEELRV